MTPDRPGEVRVTVRSAVRPAGVLSVRVAGWATDGPEGDDPPPAPPQQRRPAPPPPASPPAGRGSAAVGRSDRPAERVRVVLVVDTDAAVIGPNMRVNEWRLRAALSTGLPGAEPDALTVLSGRRATPSEVLRRLAAAAAGPDGAPLFYYCGHGGIAGGKHVLAMRHGHLNRSEVVRAVVAARPGLGVVITDCCANQTPSAGEVGEPTAVARPQQAAGPSPLSDLLLYQRGLVDLTACRPGEVTWCDPYRGGHFTAALLDALDEGGNLPPGRPLTWGAYFAVVRASRHLPYRVRPVANSTLNEE